MATSKKLKIKGGEVGSVKALRQSLKKGQQGFLARIPADGRTVRFLTEPDHWFKFFEHYDDSRTDNYYFPCTEDCEGCNDGLSASKRYLVNAVDLQDNKVIPLVLPASLAGNLLKKYDKFKTLMDRDYELTKDGTGFDTDYDALYEQPTPMNLKRFDLLDLQDVLTNQLSTDDETDEDEEDEPRPRKKVTPKKAPVRRKIVDDEEDEDETPRRVIKKPVKKAAAAPARKTLPKKKPLSKR